MRCRQSPPTAVTGGRFQDPKAASPPPTPVFSPSLRFWLSASQPWKWERSLRTSWRRPRQTLELERPGPARPGWRSRKGAWLLAPRAPIWAIFGTAGRPVGQSRGEGGRTDTWSRRCPRALGFSRKAQPGAQNSRSLGEGCHRLSFPPPLRGFAKGATSFPKRFRFGRFGRNPGSLGTLVPWPGPPSPLLCPLP